MLERVLPLVKRYGAAVVAISNDETGISEDPDVRFEVARRIVERAADHGIPASDVVVDPLVMPIGAMRTAGQQVFRLLRRLHDELRVNTTCGASNVAFGLPNRIRGERHVPRHGDQPRDDVGHHEPDARRREARRCMAADVLAGPRPGLRGVDPRAPGPTMPRPPIAPAGEAAGEPASRGRRATADGVSAPCSGR